MKPGRRRQRGYSLFPAHIRHSRPFTSDEFARHGMGDIVNLTHRNVCKDGFTVTDTADAGALFFFLYWESRNLTFLPHLVFLDLPAPWDAIEHAKSALRVRALP